jgi:hypothetical protein
MDDGTALGIIGQSLSIAMSDDIWRSFGYTKLPKYGSIINKFRPKWKTELEKGLLRELLFSQIALHLILESASTLDLDYVLKKFLIHDTIAEGLGYKSIESAYENMIPSISKYTDTSVDEWSSLILSQLEIEAIPDRIVAAKLLGGATRYRLATSRILANFSR